MQYIGNKKLYISGLNSHFNIAKEILLIDTFYDLFAGGLNVSINVDFKNVISNEINQYLVAFIQKIIETDAHYLDDVAEGVSKELYDYVIDNKDKLDKAYVYKILYIGSFRSRVTIKSRQYGKNIALQKSRINSIKREYNKYKELNLICGSYDAVNIKDHSIIYMDPPYKGSYDCYTECNDFDYKAFYRYCIEIAENNLVYISGYFMPKQFRCIDTFENKYKHSMNKEGGYATDTSIKDECLYVVKGGWGVKEVYDTQYEE